MIGQRICGCFPYALSKYWWLLCWCLITPGLCAFIMVFSWVDYKDLTGPKFPSWSDALGWLMTLCVIVAIFGTALVMFIITPGTFSDRVKYLFNPTPEWGPMLIKHRKQAAAHTSKYTKEFVIDPWGKESVVSPNDVDVQMKSSYDSGVPNIGYVPYADDNTKF